MMNQLRHEVIQHFHQKSFSTPVLGVTGGKGGVGKTTVAVNLAVAITELGYTVALVDADVDAPNAHLLLNLPLENGIDVSVTKPDFNEVKCNGCGDCIKACRLHSLFLPKGKTMVLLMGECNGCEACFLVCQEQAISKDKRVVGRTFKSQHQKLTVYTGDLVPGLEESTFVVNALKERVFSEADQYDFIIVDTSPGTHCNVINALKGADNVIAVTEPTPLGSHDLDLILSLLDLFDVKRSVFINRADMGGPNNVIVPIAQKHNTPIETGLKMEQQLLQSYVEGVPVVQMFPQSIAAKTFMQLASNIVGE